MTDDTVILNYTQFRVAFPALPMLHAWHRDELSVGLGYADGGTAGEMKWTFMEFDRGSVAVEMSVFGDGLQCFFDPRVQRAIEAWGKLPDPDKATPADLIAILEAAGAVPSRHHLHPTGPAR